MIDKVLFIKFLPTLSTLFYSLLVFIFINKLVFFYLLNNYWYIATYMGNAILYKLSMMKTTLKDILLLSLSV